MLLANLKVNKNIVNDSVIDNGVQNGKIIFFIQDQDIMT
jgi:hypothetical protein